MSNIKDINKYLKSCGSNPYREPIFRVVWSDDQFENRKGTFEEYYKGIYLRTVIATEKRRKYSYISGRWIFEKWIPPERSYTEELPDTINGSYECIYVFQDKNRKPLPLDLEVCQFIVYALYKNNDKITEKNFIEQALLDKEKKLDEREKDIIDDASSLITMQLHTGEAVSYSNIKKENNV